MDPNWFLLICLGWLSPAACGCRVSCVFLSVSPKPHGRLAKLSVTTSPWQGRHVTRISEGGNRATVMLYSCDWEGLSLFRLWLCSHLSVCPQTAYLSSPQSSHDWEVVLQLQRVSRDPSMVAVTFAASTRVGYACKQASPQIWLTSKGLPTTQ